MRSDPDTLAAFQSVFDEWFATAQRQGLGDTPQPFDVAADAFGRMAGGSSTPIRSMRAMVTVLGELCAATPEGQTEVGELFEADALIKSDKGYLIGLRFLRLFLGELRAVICDNAKFGQAGSDAGFDPKAFVVLLIGQAPGWMGLTNPALALVASLGFVIVARAGRSAFCKATDDEIVEAVVSKGSFEDPDLDSCR